MIKDFRPPAVPLVTVDPYFNIWSNVNNLHGAETIHWTGATNSMIGLVVIDGKVWRFMGGYDRRSDFKSLDAPALPQVDVRVEPLSSIYTFEGGGITLTVNFTTPLFLDDLDILARPASYVTISAVANDGRAHNVQVYYDFSAELCVDVPLQEVIAARHRLSDGTQVLQMGTEKQEILKRTGDNIRIDWGYASLVVPVANKALTAIGSVHMRDQFIETKRLPKIDDNNFPRAAEDNLPIVATVIDYGFVAEEEVSKFLVLAYDDILSVEYFHQKLPGYWARNGQSFDELLQASINEYDEIMGRVKRYNEQLREDAITSGGEKYADIVALAYRQAIAAHKLVVDENDDLLFFSKENFSNGCMATVDVSYPSIPLFLLENPELVKGMLRPVFRYAASEAWPHEFAPHDVGRYPVANGQVYGLAMERQMPIEECGNMLIMMAAVCLAEGKADFAEEHWQLLTQWADYLRQNGMDPGNQLCTDDFGGHLAHNTNLSIKAIIGIASYSILADMLGKKEDSRIYLTEAKAMAIQWERMAQEDDHYKLAFNESDSWSLKYNLVWDTLFDLNIFDPQIRKKEVAYYLKKRNQYGTPLDNRKTYTKADWLVWAAILADNQEDFEKMITPLWDFLHETATRVPFTDWYYTIDGRVAGFRNRSVVGGVFIKLLADRVKTGEWQRGEKIES
ncbi:glutaminase family protein [Lederbergia graminis]|uniref:Glutaminase domain-containing protein n=1 Tax=Lederbergia graminis TaxID=735518 RepID=A0ABW0LJ95_9BACI|nr:glutaminase family protein [Paenibacillus bovis]HLU21401.1 DUF4965 domain-containing protein [Bacillaceae bacterium]